ncbi:MAG: hypothetical protein ACRCVT_00460 [Leadbetterella sp.]
MNKGNFAGIWAIYIRMALRINLVRNLNFVPASFIFGIKTKELHA